MKNFCSVTDIKYLNKVQALNYSLKFFSDNYKLHLLCLDDETFNSVNDKNIIKYKIKDLLNESKHLQNCMNNAPSKESLAISSHNYEIAKKKQFIFSLSAYFSWYCLAKLNVDDILYIDADIYFFDNWEKIYKYIEGKSIGIVEHRCPTADYIGKYNVGIVYFKNDNQGQKCATLWKNCLISTEHQFYQSHGTCGDQKYLELFPKFFSNLVVMDNFFAHLAPWNLNYHTVKDNKLIWNGLEQELMYYHFSDFKIDYENNSYIPAARHGIIFIENEYIKNLHNKYFFSLMESR